MKDTYHWARFKDQPNEWLLIMLCGDDGDCIELFGTDCPFKREEFIEIGPAIDIQAPCGVSVDG